MITHIMKSDLRGAEAAEFFNFMIDPPLLMK
jgi:hypothetical protein